MELKEERRKKAKTWEADLDIYNEFKSILAREGSNIGDKINDMMKKYNLEHGEGNPAFDLDQFIGNPGMKAVRAFFSTRKEWDHYLQTLIKSNPKLLQEIQWQSQTIGALCQKWKKYL